MNRPSLFLAPLVAVLALAACNSGGSSGLLAPMSQAGSSVQPSTIEASGYQRACTEARIGYMHCDALMLNKIAPNVSGLGPADFQTAYNLPSSSKGAGQIVGIVDAYDNPNVASDLAIYRTNFGLGTANFTKYNQTGQTKNYPRGDPGWGFEIDLDVQMASAVCPKCTIYLIEANDNSGNSLYAAEKEAVKLGAHVISNSWGGGAGSGSGNAFNASGVTYLASAGDSGYGMQDPADYDTVVSVGGTELLKQGTTYKEQVWPFTGAGCAVTTKPSWQHDPKCAKRTGNDISAVAQGVAEYDSYPSGGWTQAAGTSVSSPMLAGVYGLAGNASARQSGKPFWTLKAKKQKKYLHGTIAGGVKGCPPSLTGSYLCVGGTGQYKTYSGPAGWGSPNGIGAF